MKQPAKRVFKSGVSPVKKNNGKAVLTTQAISQAVPPTFSKLFRRPWYRAQRGLYYLIMVGLFGLFVGAASIIIVTQEESSNNKNSSPELFSEISERNPVWGEPYRFWEFDFWTRAKRTQYEITFKDACYVDCSWLKKGRKMFVVFYSCKNLGPREGTFKFGGFGNIDNPIEIIEFKTDKGFIYSDYDSFFDYKFDGWEGGKETFEIGGISEQIISVSIPEDEIPVELIIKRTDTDMGTIRIKIPRQSFETKAGY